MPPRRHRGKSHCARTSDFPVCRIADYEIGGSWTTLTAPSVRLATRAVGSPRPHDSRPIKFPFDTLGIIGILESSSDLLVRTRTAKAIPEAPRHRQWRRPPLFDIPS